MKGRKQVVIMEKLASNNINMCVGRTQNIEVQILEQLCNSLLESRMMTGVEF